MKHETFTWINFPVSLIWKRKKKKKTLLIPAKAYFFHPCAVELHLPILPWPKKSFECNEWCSLKKTPNPKTWCIVTVMLENISVFTNLNCFYFNCTQIWKLKSGYFFLNYNYALFSVQDWWQYKSEGVFLEMPTLPTVLLVYWQRICSFGWCVLEIVLSEMDFL